MNRIITCAAIAAVAGISTAIAQATEIETFDSPNSLQKAGGNYNITRDGGTWLTSQNPVQTFGSTFWEISTHPASGTGGYGTGYHNIYFLNNPPPGSGLTNGVIDASGNNVLQLDVTINGGTDAGLFVDLQDGEGDFWQYFYGYGLTGNAANDSLSPSLSPGETITQGTLPNEEILRVPLATPHNDIFGTGMFDLSQVTLYRLENDPGATAGTGNPSDVSFYDLSVVNVPCVWNVNGGGDWNTNSNWLNTLLPNFAGAEADFFGVITAPATVATNVAVTAGILNFNNANTYTIGGAGSLTLQAHTGNAQVIVQAGTQNINVPLTIASPTVFNVSSGTTLQLSAPVTVNAGQSITQSGTGTVSYQSSISVLAGGSITFASPSHATSLSLAAPSTATIATHAGGAGPTVLQLDAVSFADATSTLDLTNNELIVAASTSMVRGYITAHELITSASGDVLGYLALGGGQTEVRATLLGDSDLNGNVNVADLANLAGNFGKTSGQEWINGDFDLNGNVNVADLADLAGNFGESASNFSAVAAQAATTSAAVPEPTTILGVMAGVAAISIRPGHRRRIGRRRVGAQCA
jgi:hypothetical protein